MHLVCVIVISRPARSLGREAKPLVARSGYIALNHGTVTNRRSRQPRVAAQIINNPIPQDRDHDRSDLALRISSSVDYGTHCALET